MERDLACHQRIDQTLAEDEHKYDDYRGEAQIFDLVDHGEAEEKECQRAKTVRERRQYGLE